MPPSPESPGSSRTRATIAIHGPQSRASSPADGAREAGAEVPQRDGAFSSVHATPAQASLMTATEAPAFVPVVSPLVQSVNFRREAGEGSTLVYPRYGNAPNAIRVQDTIAALEGGESALVLSSGMGATACALLALLRQGDHLLASRCISGGTRRLLLEEFQHLGIDVTLIDPSATRTWRQHLRRETRAIFLETPVNPTCRILDLRPVSLLTRALGIALVVDSTFASPLNFRPLEHGADVVIHSTTQFLHGHHDGLGGVVIGTAPYVEEVRQKMMLWGQAPDPFACWLLERGLKTLDVRVRRANENAKRIAEWLSLRADVESVLYPGLPGHPDHRTASTTMDGFGAMLAFILPDGAAAAARFTRRLSLIRHAHGLGGVDSLVSEPRSSSHEQLTPDERRAQGIPEGFLRLSVGIEDVDDLIGDLEQALNG